VVGVGVVGVGVVGVGVVGVGCVEVKLGAGVGVFNSLYTWSCNHA
jgi:hypothetical protein